MGQRDSDQTADVDVSSTRLIGCTRCWRPRLHDVLETMVASSLVAETVRLHVVSESTAAPSFAAETDQPHAELESSGAGASGGHSAWRSRVGGLRLIDRGPWLGVRDHQNQNQNENCVSRNSPAWCPRLSQREAARFHPLQRHLERFEIGCPSYGVHRRRAC